METIKTKAKKRTMRDDVREVRATADERVRALLGRTPEEMFWHKFDMCEAWLLSAHGRELAGWLLRQRPVWAWWLNQWAVRDMAFLRGCPPHLPKDVLEKKYRHAHSPSGILSGGRAEMMEMHFARVLDGLVEKEEMRLVAMERGAGHA